MPTQSWYEEMRMLDRANRTLAAQNAAYDAGERWRITIAPQQRPTGNIAVAAHCICGYESAQVNGADGVQIVWDYALQHLRETHDCG